MEDTEIPAILSPSTLVDNVWHAHMLRPSAYNNFCQSVFGKLIDHDMAGSKSSDDEKLKRYVIEIMLIFYTLLRFTCFYFLSDEEEHLQFTKWFSMKNLTL